MTPKRVQTGGCASSHSSFAVLARRVRGPRDSSAKRTCSPRSSRALQWRRGLSCTGAGAARKPPSSVITSCASARSCACVVLPLPKSSGSNPGCRGLKALLKFTSSFLLSGKLFPQEQELRLTDKTSKKRYSLKFQYLPKFAWKLIQKYFFDTKKTTRCESSRQISKTVFNNF